jgi:hypothetical protein
MVNLLAESSLTKRLVAGPACCPRHEKIKHRLFVVAVLSLGISIAFL